jgi:hypothetical protein
MWIVLAVLLPIGFVTGVMAIPDEVIETEFKVRKPEPFAHFITSAQNQSFLINIRKSDNIPGHQVEIDVKKPLHTSNATAYFSYVEADNVVNAGVIGRLTNRGIHRFNIGTLAYDLKKFYILFYDANKKEVFDVVKIEFD